ncbi:MAG: hypothetical protein AAGE65_13835 [Planctomycetota bacterium]
MRRDPSLPIRRRSASGDFRRRWRRLGVGLLAAALAPASSGAEAPLWWYASTTSNQSLPAQIAGDGVSNAIVYNTRGDLPAARTFLDRAAAAGVGVVMDVGRDFVAAGDLGSLENYVNELKDHPALTGWYLYDEPNEIGITVGEADAAYRRVRSLSPLLIYGAIDADRPSTQRDYIDTLDRLITFEYPFDVGDDEFEGLEDRFFGLLPGWKRITADSAARARAEGKGWYHALQAYGRDGDSPSLRLVTDAELRFMAFYSLVAHDADGVMFWARYRTDRSDALPGEPFEQGGAAWRRDLFVPLAIEFSDHYGDAVESGAIVGGVSSSDGDVFADVYRDPEDGGLFLLVVNDENAARTATLSLDSGLGVLREANRLDGAGVLAIDGQQLAVSLPAYGTASYRLVPSRVIPEPVASGAVLMTGFCLAMRRGRVE